MLMKFLKSMKGWANIIIYKQLYINENQRIVSHYYGIILFLFTSSILYLYFKTKNISIIGWVYLIGETDRPNEYKIGSTRGKDVNKRLKQLQTGNSSELFLKDSYQTDNPFKVEKMLHNRFKSSSLIGEWFMLNKRDVEDFRGICEGLEEIVESLKDNPFF